MIDDHQLLDGCVMTGATRSIQAPKGAKNLSLESSFLN